MDPLGALGLAANVVQFVEFGMNVIESVGEIRNSVSGTTAHNASLEIAASTLKEWSSRLATPHVSSVQTEDEKAIYLLACECHKISQDLLEFVSKIKPKNKKSKIDVFFSAIHDKWHENAKTELRERLEICRSQLTAQLGAFDRRGCFFRFWMLPRQDEIKSRLKEAIQFIKSNAHEMVSVRRKIDEINKEVCRISVDSGLRKLLQNVLDIPQREIAKHHILRSLAFGTMYQRFDQVDDAHLESFHWIFEEKIEDALKHERKMPSFINWLAKEGGIFHIAGKLGSGKSTLMKYLCEHEKAKKTLNGWSQQDEKELIFAQFFFWRAGDNDQKSISGLLRSLLHDVLERCPDLILSVFPEQWQYLTLLDWRIQPDLHLRTKEIRAAFDRLIHSPQLYKNHKLCFFIDGLDEYEETRQEDYRDMAEMILNWVKIAPNDVKLCVSSRELEDFETSFREDRRLRIHELTRNDMKNYALDRLRKYDVTNGPHATMDENKVELVDSILDLADGVFLWVALVLRSLREKLKYERQFCSLLRHIENMPKDMEPLFRHLLESIEQSDPGGAYRTFAMVLKLNEYKKKLPLLAYSFLADYENNPAFAMDNRVKNDVSKTDRVSMALARLRSQCKGLLEVPAREVPHDPYQPVNDPTERILVAHRSIFDFMNNETFQSNINRYCKGFDVNDAICQTYLAYFKIEGWKAGDPFFIIMFRQQNFDDVAPFRFFEALEQASTVCNSPEFSMDSLYRDLGRSRSMDYISWKIANDPTFFMNGGAKIKQMLWVSLDSWNIDVAPTILLTLLPPIKEGLFHLGDLTPTLGIGNTISHCFELFFTKVMKQLPLPNPAEALVFGEYIELFLKSGADEHMSARPYYENGKPWFELTGPATRRAPMNEEMQRYFSERGNKEASLEELVDFWQLPNANRIKEIIGMPPSPLNTTEDASISDLESSDSSSVCEDIATPDKEISVEEHYRQLGFGAAASERQVPKKEARDNAEAYPAITFPAKMTFVSRRPLASNPQEEMQFRKSAHQGSIRRDILVLGEFWLKLVYMSRKKNLTDQFLSAVTVQC
ncbi:hypothetical protein AJ79_04284 [Helicocarpus griseus UAMH5409]|uniref:Uncharacterized protein n=1 Tax=Helicocarpus griseus UAMH5409 TaxID=1447875 RepID=A0A2B7XV40_9EURO|nr:hypothetical protein AJ79_04284 [Helicocarpus griseus UAMH5409]